ncbi:FG-GAP-like repeat-containing protein, partial [Microcoleus sp. Pol12B4]|uniref:FG-GAP-like repeat-containing protein n=1 Tax=Microcoleus sp. Pol12B4 TaxID=3055395 RepID=UPI002FD609F6
MPNLNNQVSIKSIAFIDPKVENYQSLIAGVKPGTEVVVLDGNRDTIDQITDILALRTNIDSIHIVSHGAPGSLQLGDVRFSLDDIECDRDSLQQWFSPQTDSRSKNRPNILLYGCSVAAGETGKAFVKRLSELTGASVAASQNLTGSVAKGGDWELEVRTGKIETPLVFEAEVLAGYEYVLNSFGAATNFGAGRYPVSAGVGDFNGDTKPDLAFSNLSGPGGSSPGTSILLRNGTGSFGTATLLPRGSNTLAVGKFNTDIYDDLVVDNGNGSVSIFYGSSTGLGAPVDLSFDSLIAPTYIAAADFNGDGRADLALASYRATGSTNTNGVVSILLQNSDGTFALPQNFLVVKFPESIAVADFDGNGKQDLAVTSSMPNSSNSVSILLQNGSGSFGAANNITVGLRPYSLAVGKFNNNDNFPDLAVTNFESNSISILRGNGSGGFTTTEIPVGSSPTFVTVADLNGDSKQDLAVGKNDNKVSILLGNGDGTFTQTADLDAGPTPTAVAVKHLNEDGLPELDGKGLPDFDEDGLPDLAVTSFSHNVSVFLNTPNTVNFGTATYSGTEGSADTVIPVTLSGGTPLNNVVVPIVIDPSSTATENSDYTFSPTTITFPAGTATLTQNVAVTIKPDNLPENAETAILNLGAITGGIAGTTKQTTLNIAANGTVSYAIVAGTASIPEGNTGTKPLTFTATRSGNTGGASSVNYTIAGTATNVSDYNNIGGTSGATTPTGTINFAADETSKTITLDVLGDTLAEPDETIAVTLSSPTSPGVTPTITTATATTTITNDDKAGFTINPTALTTSEVVGGTATFTVKLNSQPTADVAIDLSSSNVAEGTVSPASITFTPATYDQLQIITVSGVDDAVADGPQPYKIVTKAVSSNDPNYNNLDPEDVTVTNSDNETPGITINPTAGLTTGEDGTKANFTVVLNTQPTADVTIGLNTDNAAEGTVSPASITFTPADWKTARQVTVTGVNDNIVDGNIDYKIVTKLAVSDDPNYKLDAADVSITNKDDDTAGISITPTQTTATEGGATGSYELKLTSEPKLPVTINFTGIEIDAIAPVILDSTNWDRGKTITFTATDDSKAEGPHSGKIAHSVSSSDPKYSGTAIAIQDVNVAITDNDTAGVSITPTSTNATEGGAESSYTVKLNSQPNAPVKLILDTGSQIKAISTINFDSSDWNVLQKVTVTAIDDSKAEGTHTGKISHRVESADTKYATTAVQDVNVAITDNETAGVSIAPTSITATEGGATGSYTVKLNSEPNEPVNFIFNTDNQIKGIPAIKFDSTNWEKGETITVTAIDDRKAEGAHTGKISHLVDSLDPNYSGTAIQAVNVAITDNDTADVIITPTSTTATEGGATGSYTVKLNSQPIADVKLNFDTGSEIKPISEITFNSSTWDRGTKITVTATDDSTAEGAHSGKIGHTVISSDPNYSETAVQDVNVGITDNDTAGVIITPTSTTATEGGATGSYTVKLNTQPKADVKLSFQTGSQINPISEITFNSTNWEKGETVTVTATDDLKTEGAHTGTIAHTLTSTDSNYSGQTVQDVNVAITDNEKPGVTIAPTSTTATEDGATGSYTVQLNTQPSAPVSLSFNTGSEINPVSAINFNSTDWNIAQKVTVTATDDLKAEYAHSGTIAHIVSSPDPNYSGTAVQDVKVEIADNDAAYVLITPTSTTATEGVANGNYEIKLTSQPIAPVNINFTTDQQIAAIAPLTFTADNWNVPQSVTAKAVDDTIVEGAHSANIVHYVSSSDTRYNTALMATVAITDNDTGPLLGIPTVKFSQATYQVNESPTGVQKQITLTRTGTAEALNKISQVYIQPVNGGSATLAKDWNFASSDSGQVTVTFNPGQATQTFTINILPDTQGEGTEEIAFRIASADNANIGPQSSTTLQIFDADRLFTDTNAISGLSSAIWGDYNNDGKLDILGNRYIYDNTGTYNNNTGQKLSEYGFSEANRRDGYGPVWADYNNDGRLDTSAITNNGNDTFKYEIYSNGTYNGGVQFTPGVLANNLSSAIVRSSSADYNNDGRPDLLLNTQGSGSDYSIATTLYRNTGSMYQDRFQDSKARLDTGEPLFSTSEIAGATSSGVWADFDNDGKLDILIKVRESQQSQSGWPRQKAKLYRNLGDGVFKDTNVSLPGLGSEFPPFGANVYDMAWGDFDNDGKLDILLTGAIDGANGSGQLFTKVYRNTTSTNGSASFEDIGAQIPGLSQAKAAWGDFDNDGKLDILLTGGERQDFQSPGTSVTKVYRNTGNGFTDSGAQIDSGAKPGDKFDSQPAWGDYDKDGKLDILLTGYSTSNPYEAIYENDSFTKVFRNNTPNANTPPAAPTGLTTVKSDGGTVTFKWNKATDLQTPADGLSYNLQVKTSEGKDILSPMSLWDGTRQIVGLGNVSQNTQWQLKNLPRGEYNWGVQAIDNAWAGSPFAFGGSFTVNNSAPEEQINLGSKPTEFNQPIKNVYTDPDGDQINYQLTLPDGSPLYSDSKTSWLWLQDYGQNTITFTGTPPSGSQPFKVKLIATDNYGGRSEQTFTVTTKDGRWVIDGYISGATVFLDANKNSILDTNEPSTTTDTGGKFNLNIPFEIFDTNKNGEIDPSEGNLVAIGGIDTATGLPLETPVTAPPDASVVTLLTTLIADLIDKGIEPEEAQSLVKAALGLPAEVDLTSLDPIEATNNNQPGGVQVLSAMVKVQNFITQTSALIDGASSAVNTDIVKAVVSSITNQIQSGTVLNLSNAAALEPIIQQTAAKIQQIDPSFNSQQVSQITPQSATVMATANQRIDAAVSNPTATSIPESLARLQQVALGPTTQDFKEVGSGNKPISQVVADNTGTALDSRIEAVILPVGIATPVVSGDADLGSNSPDAILGTNGDD